MQILNPRAAYDCFSMMVDAKRDLGALPFIGPARRRLRLTGRI